MAFNYRTNSIEANDEIFQLIRKTQFLAHFWSIWEQKTFCKIQLYHACSKKVGYQSQQSAFTMTIRITSLSTFTKSAQFINLFLRYSRI